jgi:uncharacterized protein (TIGR00255 family)
MIRSMTGYGEAERSTAAGRIQVELRTVNHRYLNVNARLPTAMARWEPEIRDWLREYISRGHVNCTIRLDRDGDAGGFAGYRLDEERVKAYLGLFGELADRFNIPGTPDLDLLARYGDIIVRAEPDDAEGEIAREDLKAAIEEAGRHTLEMRADEGLRLHRDLVARVSAIEGALDEIERLAPARLVAERDRLRAAVRQLLDGIEVDEQRVAQEIAFLSERWDINEELVRFRSHIELFRELLDGAEADPVGKRLAFLVQEMHREANTISSKANNAAIGHGVVAIKEEIERLREQVENVE